MSSMSPLRWRASSTSPGSVASRSLWTATRPAGTTWPRACVCSRASSSGRRAGCLLNDVVVAADFQSALWEKADWKSAATTTSPALEVFLDLRRRVVDAQPDDRVLPRHVADEQDDHRRPH